jgi:hypothetical protein
MSRIKIKDLSVDLEELKKKDPEILSKIRGGAVSRLIVKMPIPESNYFSCKPDSRFALCDTCNFGCPSTGKY